MNHPLQDLARRLAEELVGEVEGVYAAQVATIDGFDLAQAQRRELSASRVAAMSSALAALGTELGREVGIGRSRGVVVDAEEGHAVVQAVQRADGALVVTALADRRAMLGMVMLRVAECGRALAAA